MVTGECFGGAIIIMIYADNSDGYGNEDDDDGGDGGGGDGGDGDGDKHSQYTVKSLIYYNTLHFKT